MRIRIIETISNTYNESRELLKTKTSESYVLFPAEGKAIRNKLTGEIIEHCVGVGTEDNVENYEEIDWEVI